MWPLFNPSLLTMSSADKLLYGNIVKDWESTLNRAIANWQKFTANRVKFTGEQQTAILAWYKDFPRLWEAVRPNFEGITLLPGETMHSKKVRLLEKSDAFVYGNRDKWNRGLGVPVVLVGTFLVSAAVGIAGALWAIGYIRKQGNISSLIDKVAAGSIPTSVLNNAIKADAQSSSPFGDIGGIVKWGAIGLALFFLVPPLLSTFKAGNRA